MVPSTTATAASQGRRDRYGGMTRERMLERLTAHGLTVDDLAEMLHPKVDRRWPRRWGTDPYKNPIPVEIAAWLEAEPASPPTAPPLPPYTFPVGTFSWEHHQGKAVTTKKVR